MIPLHRCRQALLPRQLAHGRDASGLGLDGQRVICHVGRARERQQLHSIKLHILAPVSSDERPPNPRPRQEQSKTLSPRDASQHDAKSHQSITFIHPSHLAQPTLSTASFPIYNPPQHRPHLPIPTTLSSPPKHLHHPIFPDHPNPPPIHPPTPPQKLHRLRHILVHHHPPFASRIQRKVREPATRQELHRHIHPVLLLPRRPHHQRRRLPLRPYEPRIPRRKEPPRHVASWFAEGGEDEGLRGGDVRFWDAVVFGEDVARVFFVCGFRGAVGSGGVGLGGRCRCCCLLWRVSVQLHIWVP